MHFISSQSLAGNKDTVLMLHHRTVPTLIQYLEFSPDPLLPVFTISET